MYKHIIYFYYLIARCNCNKGIIILNILDDSVRTIYTGITSTSCSTVLLAGAEDDCCQLVLLLYFRYERSSSPQLMKISRPLTNFTIPRPRSPTRHVAHPPAPFFCNICDHHHRSASLNWFGAGSEHEASQVTSWAWTEQLVTVDEGYSRGCWVAAAG